MIIDPFFSQLIINWYHIFGRKKLPWQIQNTPYKTWLSEIMLQQTQVKTAIPYFKKFIKKFPNIISISKASIQDVLHIWSGLGYYQRAHNLHKTSKIITEKYQGNVPDTFANLIQLPGIGRSTAGAILSLAFGYCYPVLDGNIKRIVSRYYGINTSINKYKTEKKLWNIINYLIPLYNTGIFNQGMMDLGAIICTKNNPKCNICPIKKNCISFSLNNFTSYFKKSKISYLRKIYFIIIQNNQLILLQKRSLYGIWANLFSFPEFDKKNNAILWIKKLNVSYKKQLIIHPFYHQLTHIKFHIIPIHIKLIKFKTNIINIKNNIWYNLIHPQIIGLPSPVKKILHFIKKNT
ncbi:A/G-specific adenine glycosylase [Buchnera aphidicola (Formosaphis micheliae)]|uniref:A/G-specific adenine glycosylase n=1 Tax=Buchnera aphidicola TaxID=9 RepID=UPI0031CC8E32